VVRPHVRPHRARPTPPVAQLKALLPSPPLLGSRRRLRPRVPSGNAVVARLYDRNRDWRSRQLAPLQNVRSLAQYSEDAALRFLDNYDRHRSAVENQGVARHGGRRGAPDDGTESGTYDSYCSGALQLGRLGSL
jgi:hypothetical protein